MTRPTRTSTFFAVQPEGRLCPRCQVALFEGDLHGATLLGCGKCGGVWLDNRACHALVRGSSDALVALAERAARVATAVPDEMVAACPVCTRPLTPTVAAPTTVTIDTCTAHGTWFDPNELRILALAYAKLPAPAQFSPEAFNAPTEPASLVEERRSFFAADDDDDGGWPALAFNLLVGLLNAVLESSDNDRKT